jgi:hypothetical protein
VSLPVTDLVGGLLGLSLTLSVFSYLFRDNALFRIAVHVFIGVTAGYVAVVAWFNVIWPHLLSPIIFRSGNLVDTLLLLIPLMLSSLLLTKLSRRFSRLGNPVMAFVIGVGVAAAIGGATLGTLYPQVQASINVFNTEKGYMTGGDLRLRTLNAGVILISTIATLIYFQFKKTKALGDNNGGNSWLESLSLVGKAIIAVVLGVIFAGVYIAGLSVLVDRIHVIVSFVVSLINSLVSW